MNAADLQPFGHLYLHIPFCRHKCGYCDFNAYAGMDRLMPAYVAALEGELEAARERFRFEPLRTVYFGGGTPSLLPGELTARLLGRVERLFHVEHQAEVTLESNPASTDAEKLAAWRAAGVNRLSLGLQGFDPRALAVLERRTDGAQAERAFAAARAAGFGNISLDLIYGVPHQSLEAWRRTVVRAAELEPEHLSVYCLSFEAGTLLERRRQAGLLPEVDPDSQWAQLEVAVDELASRGYQRYEVSSWSRPGFESRHNRAYWSCRPVYGAGAGAHSYASGGERAWRWWNVARPRDYIARSPDVRQDGEQLEARQVQSERLMLGLRTTAGVAPPAGFEPELGELERLGLVERRDGSGTVAPTRRGLDLHNQVALAVL
jgi:oxygen-independent coproporphyrinogen-3 oxidase